MKKASIIELYRGDSNLDSVLEEIKNRIENGFDESGSKKFLITFEEVEEIGNW